MEHTEDAGVFRPDDLARFKAVGFVNTTGNVLDRAQQRAFEAFVEAGGGYLGIHSAADTGYDWPWYGQLLGAQFKSHPPGLQTGVVRFARPLGAPAPIAWRVTDEFYDFASRPSGEATVIARLDESTYEGGEMGAEHPIAWCQRFTAAGPGIPASGTARSCLPIRSFSPTSTRACAMPCPGPRIASPGA